jgi:hypothetical protein
MGAGITKLFKLGKGKEQRIVMLGLDAAGKTYGSNVSEIITGAVFFSPPTAHIFLFFSSTILYKIKMGEVVQTTPTIGMSDAPLQFVNY